ncbi:MAG: apolipoprotein N-acyltransferase, partial [Bacteroidota bacterium]
SFVPVLLNSAFMCIPFVLYHVVHVKLGRPWAFLAFVAFWISFEFGHMQWEITWPWLTLGNSFAQYPSWVQWYEFTGHLGGSLYILLINFFIYKNIPRLLSSIGKRKILLRLIGLISLLILSPILISLAMYYAHKEKGDPVKVAVIQPNFEPHYEKFQIRQADQVERFLNLSESILDQETDYLVFPETSFRLIDVERSLRHSQIRKIKSFLYNYPNLKLITGLSSMRQYDEKPDVKWIRTYNAPGDEPIFWEAQNSAVQMDFNATDTLDYYIKSKLVPGAEIHPYHQYLFFIKPLVDKLGGTIEGHATQKERSVFTGGKAKVAAAICYESIYGAYVGQYMRNGANVIFIVTNDGWWDNTAGHIQHLKFGALRAIEHRRSIARSANTGISCFINQRGDILQATKYGETIAISGSIQMNEKLTFYSRFGDWIAWICLGLTVLLFARLIMNPKKSESK